MLKVNNKVVVQARTVARYSSRQYLHRITRQILSVQVLHKYKTRQINSYDDEKDLVGSMSFVVIYLALYDKIRNYCGNRTKHHQH